MQLCFHGNIPLISLRRDGRRLVLLLPCCLTRMYNIYIIYIILWVFGLSLCLQIDVSYNVPDPVSKPAFQLKVDLKEPIHERHLQPPSVSSTSRHSPLRSRSRVDNRSELNRKRRTPIDDDDPAAHQDKMDFHISLEVCARYKI